MLKEASEPLVEHLDYMGMCATQCHASPRGTDYRQFVQIPNGLVFPWTGGGIVPPSSKGSRYHKPLDTNERDVRELTETEKDTLRTKNLALLLQHESVTIGSDPEFFLEEGGTIIPAWTVLPSKEAPIELSATLRDGSLTPAMLHSSAYWDGLQAEARFKDTAMCLDVVVYGIEQALLGTLREVRKLRPQARLSSRSVIEVPTEQLIKYPQEYVQFGCKPSLNAYGHEWEPVIDPYSINMRPAGGHIHFGHKGITDSNAADIVKAVDAILGIMSVGMFQHVDNPKRRTLYGKAGEYRKTSYGLEYRVLSNQWCLNSTVGYLTLDLARASLYMYLQGYFDSWLTTDMEVEETINTANVSMAHSILGRNMPMIEGLLLWMFPNNGTSERSKIARQAALQAMFEGIPAKAFADPEKNLQPVNGSNHWMVRGTEVMKP